MLTGSPPYRKLPKEVAICNIIENDKPPFPERISKHCADFLSKCFIKNPNERATVEFLLQHPWITSNISKDQYKPKIITNNKKNNQSLNIDIHNILKTYDLQIDIHLHQGGLSNDKIQEIIEKYSQNILNQFIVKKQNSSTDVDIFNISVEDLRIQLAELEIENKFLVSSCEHIHETLTNQLVEVSSNLQQANFELEESQLRKSSIAKKICILEESYANVQSDTSLAKLIYGSKIPILHFNSGIRGVLLLKRGGNSFLFYFKRKALNYFITI